MTEEHAVVEQGDDDGEAAVADTWPLASLLRDLEKVSPGEIVNAENLGALRFTGADDQYREVLQTLRDLRLEDWNQLPTDLVSEIEGNATARAPLPLLDEQPLLASPPSQGASAPFLPRYAS